VQPGEVFGLSEEGQDRYVLSRMASHHPKPAKVRIVKSGRYTVGVLDHAIALEAVQSALDRFP
jgi:hypothetical protein